MGVTNSNKQQSQSAGTTMVVSVKMPIVSTLILPSAAVFLSLTIALTTDTMISGTTIICNSLTYPVPTISKQALVVVIKGRRCAVHKVHDRTHYNTQAQACKNLYA